MGRPRRNAKGGWVYHVLNRSNARVPIFDEDADFVAFEKVLEQATERYQMRLVSYCVMPNHWHLVLWPRQDGDLSRFTGWLTLTHTQRWHAHRGTSGQGHLYQGRFKSFPVQGDDHFYNLCRYVERNPMRARLVDRAEQWRWSSLWRLAHGSAQQQALLCIWPLPRPRQWRSMVNKPQTEAEEHAILRAIQRGTPLGDPAWTKRTAAQLGLESTIRPRGRPSKGGGKKGS